MTTPDARLSPSGLQLYAAIVAHVLRDKGSMSAKRADVLAHDVVVALDHLGWLRKSVGNDQ